MENMGYAGQFLIFLLWTCIQLSIGDGEIPCLCTQEISNLPTFSSIQIGQHTTKVSRIWTSYRAGVYDITDFIDKHPGGLEPILRAVGSHLEMYWATLPVHMTQRVYNILEGCRIGNLNTSDRSTYKYNPFKLEKNRSHLMEVITEEPYNAHANSLDLSKSFITPNDYHYVRLHLPIPWINIDQHTLTISGIGIETAIKVSMEYIKKTFVKSRLNATLQCSGNRRSELNRIKLTHGVPYKHTAISTATWGGILLLDIINHYRVDVNNSLLNFVNFEGADHDLTGMHYATSIPKGIALNPEADLFLAYEMNGEPLPRDHGYPLRLIAPGMAGFRSVKFLHKIILAESELTDVWERRMYRFYSAKYDWDNVDYNSAPPLYYTNVQSAILTPGDGDVVRFGRKKSILVGGYAFSGGGNGILRVDVTTDGGETWIQANITDHLNSPPRRTWTWIFWKAEISVDVIIGTNSSNAFISCRAFDTSYNSQPNGGKMIWNMMGVLVNHWHTVGIVLAKDSR